MFYRVFMCYLKCKQNCPYFNNMNTHICCSPAVLLKHIVLEATIKNNRGCDVMVRTVMALGLSTENQVTVERMHSWEAE